MMRGLLAIAIVAAPVAGHADGIANEISAGTTSRSSWIANRVSGEWELDERLAVQVGYSVTGGATSSQAGSLAVSYAAGDHWSISGAARWVPAWTSSSSRTYVIDDELVEAEVATASSSGSLVLSANYDTAGDGERETSAGLTLGVDHAAAMQAFTSLVAGDGEMLSLDELRARCRMHTCRPDIEAALSPVVRRQSQVSISASVVRTAYRTFDVGLDATYYLYGADLAGQVRVTDNGVANAPLRYAVAPMIGHRWGALHAMAGGSYGSYVASQGYEVGVLAKVQYALAVAGNPLRLHSTLGGAWTVDDFQDMTTSFALAFGGKYSW